MSRLGAGADAVFAGGSVDAIVSAAEDGIPAVGLRGRTRSDARGMFHEIHGIGDAEVGMSVVLPDGGTDPGDDVRTSFSERFPDGVLVVVDPYAGEFAVYVSESGVLRKASAVVSERSDPDGVPVPHLLLGDVAAGHEVADDAVEEQQ